MSVRPRGRLRDRGRAHDLARAVGMALRNTSLARAELAFGAAVGADWLFTIGLGVVAFEDGGARMVGLVSMLRLLPSAVGSPVIAAVADRMRRERVLAASSAVVAASTSTAALLLTADQPAGAVYGLAVITTIGLTPYRAAHSALLPSLTRTTEELAAANLVRGLVESIAVVAGPLLAAVLLAATEPSVVMGAAAASAAAAMLLVAHLRYDEVPRIGGTDAADWREEVTAGLRAARADPDALLLFGVAGAQTFVRGALSVFTVVLAIDLLDRGESGVGVLQGAVGVGALLGSVAASGLVTTRRMATWLGVAVALWGLPMCVVGSAPGWWLALVMLGAIGVANAMVDVTLFTMIGRLVPDAVLARVHGAFEMVVAATVALGALVASLLVEHTSARVAMAVCGAVAPAVVAITWARLRRLDELLGARQDRLDVLQRVPMLRTLPVPAIEHLARNLRPRSVAPGQAIVQEGALGTAYYVIVDGSVEVFEHGSVVRAMGPGEGFGEISLLRGTRRTAGVRAASGDRATELLRIDRDDLVRSVRGYGPAATEATATIDRWMG